jgi:mannitol-1-phosphate 5-dehydrogenase
MASHVFTGFGFGPIQAGLFVKEAFQSGNFARIVAAEIDQDLVDAVRANGGSYNVNVARSDGIEVLRIDNVEMLNPNIPRDKKILFEALAQSTEITTCLPSVDFYDAGGAASVAQLLAQGLKNSRARATIVYTAENNNRAAEILDEAVSRKLAGGGLEKVQFLNTVIGKMSRVVTEPGEIQQRKLAAIAPGIQRAFLVEAFNRILVTRTRISGFKPGIEVFIEKDDLLPFEEAKLYGHNAIHALLGFVGALKGYTSMTEVGQDSAIMKMGRNAFLKESGAALIKKYAHLRDRLFTEAGYEAYAEDLLERITNPYLADTVARVSRDIVRKLGLNERIFGTMQLVLEYGIEPMNMALGAIAGIALLLQKADEYRVPQELRFAPDGMGGWRCLEEKQIRQVLNWVWAGQECADADRLIQYTHQAMEHLSNLVG